MADISREIAEAIIEDLKAKPTRSWAELKYDAEQIIRAKLEEREAKVRELIRAVESDICSVPCGEMCCGKLRAALEALK